MVVKTVAVVGCGLMGTGIAEACVRAGIRTIAIKATPGDPAPARARIQKSLDRAVAKNRLSAEERDACMERLQVVTGLSAVGEADLVIESAAENLAAKQSMLVEMEGFMREEALLGSNTSALRLSALASVLKRPQLFMGLHFFSPANIMKLVEVGPIEATTTQALNAAVQFCEAITKTPVVVGDHPGYIVNRLLVPYILHAIETLEQKVASPEAIDTAMRLGCGHPLGPLALADVIGLDVVLAMARSLYQEHMDARYRAPASLRRLVADGQLGKKTGAGFYRYDSADRDANPALFYFDEPSSPSAAGRV